MDRRLPLHVFHFDCFWMRAFHWCDFEWNPETFPDPEGMIDTIHARIDQPAGIEFPEWC